MVAFRYILKASAIELKEETDMADLISQVEAARLRGVTRAAIQNLVRRGLIRSGAFLGDNTDLGHYHMS